MRRPKIIADHPHLSETTPIVRLWILRILVRLKAYHKLVGGKEGFRNELLTEVFNLQEGDFLTPGGGLDMVALLTKLQELYLEAESSLSNATVPDSLTSNALRISRLIGLNPAERRILEFTVMLHVNGHLDSGTKALSTLSPSSMSRVLGLILALPEQAVASALSMQSILARSGLITLGDHDMDGMRSLLQPMTTHFAERMIASRSGPSDLLKGTVRLSDTPLLQPEDFAHLQPGLGVLIPYIKQAVGNRRRGINMLLHGVPGTGKTQLSRVLGQQAGLKVFEVVDEGVGGAGLTGRYRLNAYRAAQHFFARRPILLVFDEIEDIFRDGQDTPEFLGAAQTRKAWMNHMLEENPVPTLWITNSIHGLDPAFIRRFDMVLELPVPPRSRRQHILRAACGDLLEEEVLARVAESDALAPAVVSRAAAVVRSIRNELDEQQAARAFERLINSTLEAQGHAPLGRGDAARLPALYDPIFTHASADLAQVAAGLKQAGAGRLCLYGPPGTGKTAYARWVARQLDRPLLLKRASDLLSMWVGEAEKNIARAFREAEADGAVLLLDEVDSFLQDRREAQRSWEVTQVNELLTQMEAFSGVFIATTNLMDNLDAAALRRFDLKVRFDYLLPEQAEELLARHCLRLELESPGPDDLARLHALRLLTPGDFAAVLRQNRFRPIPTAADLVAALQAECAVKDAVSAPIGFIQ